MLNMRKRYYITTYPLDQILLINKLADNHSSGPCVRFESVWSIKILSLKQEDKLGLGTRVNDNFYMMQMILQLQETIRKGVINYPIKKLGIWRNLTHFIWGLGIKNKIIRFEVKFCRSQFLQNINPRNNRTIQSCPNKNSSMLHWEWEIATCCIVIMNYSIHKQETHFCLTGNNWHSNQQNISAYSHKYKKHVVFISNLIILL